jgi:hypothetical protein
MPSTTPTLTYTAVAYGPNGNARRITVSLPYVSIIASEPHYAAPPPLPELELLAIERPPRWSEKLIRRTLGKDRKRSAKLRNQLSYRAALRRIDKRGV